MLDVHYYVLCLWEASLILNVINSDALPLFDNHGKQSLHILFRGRLWHFVAKTRAYRLKKRLGKEITSAPFLSYTC